MKTNLAQLIVAAALGATATLAFHAQNVHAASEPAAKAAEAPKGPSYAERMERGKQIAGAVCVACHGLDGYSPIPANPNIGGMPAEYIAKQLALYKSGARANAIMQGMSAGLSDADMQALGTYYFAQRGKTAAVARDEKVAKRGELIYRVGIPKANVPACASCHGAFGAGIPAIYPKLAGQWPEYTFEELKEYASGARKNVQMNAIASRMTLQQQQDVAEYIAGMRTNLNPVVAKKVAAAPAK